MKELPRNFPELSLLYKTLDKKIMRLKNEIKEMQNETMKNHIKMKIDNYQTELNKIKGKFPDGFFESKQ